MLKRFLLLLLACALGACSANPILSDGREDKNLLQRIFSIDTYQVYRIDIEQGNQLKRSRIKQIEPGFTKEQVHFLLGHSMTPTLFRNNRWDYTFYLKDAANKRRQRLAISIFFRDDQVVDVCQHIKKKIHCLWS